MRKIVVEIQYNPDNAIIMRSNRTGVKTITEEKLLYPYLDRIKSVQKEMVGNTKLKLKSSRLELEFEALES